MEQTGRHKGALIPRGVAWIRAAAALFKPERQSVVLAGRQSAARPGLQLNRNG